MRRNATREFIDFVALADRLEAKSDAGAWSALEHLDALYPQPSGESVLQHLARQLAEPKPYDPTPEGAALYRLVSERYQAWNHLAGRALDYAQEILARLPGGDESGIRDILRALCPVPLSPCR
ncbi:MAG TPA: hypothetical protein VMV73_06205 [Candidatus Dormibacteraeota bacterium]|nr:hypothetical protein [Candidatus Dormibacteraeota bacterium]